MTQPKAPPADPVGPFTDADFGGDVADVGVPRPLTRDAVARALAKTRVTAYGTLIADMQRRRRAAVWLPRHLDPVLAEAQAAVDAADAAGCFDALPWKDKAALRRAARALLGPGWRVECIHVGRGIVPRIHVLRAPR